MSLSRYEVLILAKTTITNEETASIEKAFGEITEKEQGNVFSFDKWGKYQLAYPVQKESYGVYMLVRFEVPHDIVKQVVDALDYHLKIKCTNFVMRHVFVKLAHDAPDNYAKPEPFDAARKDFDDKKAHRIKTLINSVPEKQVASDSQESSSESSNSSSQDASESSTESAEPVKADAPVVPVEEKEVAIAVESKE